MTININKKRIVDIYEPSNNRTPEPSGRILLKPDTANIVRRISKHLNITMDELVQNMLMEWIPKNTGLSIEIIDKEAQ